jgi:hypothetical protein
LVDFTPETAAIFDFRGKRVNKRLIADALADMPGLGSPSARLSIGKIRLSRRRGPRMRQAAGALSNGGDVHTVHAGLK